MLDRLRGCGGISDHSLDLAVDQAVAKNMYEYSQRCTACLVDTIFTTGNYNSGHVR